MKSLIIFFISIFIVSLSVWFLSYDIKDLTFITGRATEQVVSLSITVTRNVTEEAAAAPSGGGRATRKVFEKEVVPEIPELPEEAPEIKPVKKSEVKKVIETEEELPVIAPVKKAPIFLIPLILILILVSFIVYKRVIIPARSSQGSNAIFLIFWAFVLFTFSPQTTGAFIGINALQINLFTILGTLFLILSFILFHKEP
ncbi:hypothetical protein HY498_00600 [Candidatus Woesearchaeota archaeon]|nr:hypothetical protein [Candidatus Woesearchaeota archaeon]